MRRVRWWLSGVLALSVWAGVARAQVVSLSMVALASPLGQEAPASADCCEAASCETTVSGEAGINWSLLDLLRKWDWLWAQGMYPDAEAVATEAVQVAPASVEARHALILAQVVRHIQSLPTAPCASTPPCELTAAFLHALMHRRRAACEGTPTACGTGGAPCPVSCAPAPCCAPCIPIQYGNAACPGSSCTLPGCWTGGTAAVPGCYVSGTPACCAETTAAQSTKACGACCSECCSCESGCGCGAKSAGCCCTSARAKEKNQCCGCCASCAKATACACNAKGCCEKTSSCCCNAKSSCCCAKASCSCCKCGQQTGCGCGKTCACAKSGCACGDNCACKKNAKRRAVIHVLPPPPPFMMGISHMPMPPMPLPMPCPMGMCCPGMPAGMCPAGMCAPGMCPTGMCCPPACGACMPPPTVNFVRTAPAPSMPACPPMPGQQVTPPCPPPGMPACPPLCPVLHYDTAPMAAWGMRATLVSQTPDASVRITHDGRGIHVQSPCFDGHCDRVTVQDAQHRVLLEGNVQLSARGDNQPARIEAQRVLVNLRDGSFEVNPAALLPMPTPVWTQPVSRPTQVPMPTTIPSCCQPQMPTYGVAAPLEEQIQAPRQKEALPSDANAIEKQFIELLIRDAVRSRLEFPTVTAPAVEQLPAPAAVEQLPAPAHKEALPAAPSSKIFWHFGPFEIKLSSDDPHVRTEQLLNSSGPGGQIERDGTHLTPIRVHGGLSPN